jgi:hypothetical protein
MGKPTLSRRESPRTAHPTSHACLFGGVLLALLLILPLSAMAEGLCNGRYKLAEEMLDAAYGKFGTLYSGGGHFSNRDNVGATLDLWRLWNGWPDLKLREARTFHYDWKLDPLLTANSYSAPQRSAQIDWAISVVNGLSDPVLTPVQRYTIAAVLDLATAPGRTLGWWLDPDVVATYPKGRSNPPLWRKESH